MDLAKVKITHKDIERVLAEANPAVPAAFAGDACKAYADARPYIQVAIAILTALYPPGSSALAAIVAIMDQACKGQ
jgi:hypothetical protein